MSAYSSYTGQSLGPSIDTNAPTRPGTYTETQESQLLSEDQIQIGRLGFQEIKESIISYLSREEVDNPLKDIDFASSAINVLVDALAYNTLYYAYYSNAIVNELYLDTAQRLESLISITKPLGFTVNAKTSSQATLNMTSLSARIPKFSKFTGIDDAGKTYTFYTRQSYERNDENAASGVVVHEAKDLILNRDITSQIDLTQQEYILADDRIDIGSIIIEVSEDGGSTFTEYTKSNAVNTTISSSSRVYFVERLNDGIKIIFSARGEGEYVYNDELGTNRNISTDNVGRKIVATDRVRITYFIPSGEQANGVRTFEYSGAGTVAVVGESSFGSDGPNPDLIRFFAPKWFAAQDRAVTKNDYYALISDLVSQDSSVDETVAVFGGEDLNPPYYGRVFVSAITDSSETASQEIVDRLGEKAPVSIIPEFIPYTDFNLNLAYSVNYVAGQTTKTKSAITGLIQDAVNDRFGGNKRFNNSFVLTDFIDAILAVDPSIIRPSISLSHTMTTETTITAGKRTFISFKNKLDDGIEGQALFSSTFTSDKYNRSDVYIVDSSLEPDIYGYSPLFLATDVGTTRVIVETGGVGDINYETGLLRINPDVIQGNSAVTFTAKPEFLDVFAGQEMVLSINQRDVRIIDQ
tara:strand:+ start:1277 stop:3187 length:1911 start_codon:yes stop_codon:yes gene_type:complete